MTIKFYSCSTTYVVNCGARLILDVTEGFHAETFKSINRLAETLNNFECHHLQNDFYLENNLNRTLEILLIYLALLLILLLLLVL